MGQLFDTANLEAVMRDIATDIRENYKDELLLHDRKATGGLLDSIRTEVEVNGTVWAVTMELEEYWKYVENGTKPHWPPRDAILRWIQTKPVIPRPGRDGRIPTPQQLAFLISRKIARVGTEGSNDLKRTTDAVLPMYEDRLLEALQRDTVQYIRKLTAEM